MTNPDIAHPAIPHADRQTATMRPPRPRRAEGFRRSLWEIQKSGLGARGDSHIFRRPLLSLSNHKGTHHEHKQAGRPGGARPRNRGGTSSKWREILMELLAESERHKEHLDRLCAKLEALPKVVKKKTRQ
jgi:hypothetical protein